MYTTTEDIGLSKTDLTFELRLDDVCLPDYWNGSSNVCLAVPVDGGMTVEDVIEGIEFDFQSSDWFETDEEWNAARNAIDDFKEENKENLEKICFPDLEKWEEHEEEQFDSCYAYFEFVKG